MTFSTRARLRNTPPSFLRNPSVNSIDSLQPHCPPTEVYHHPEVTIALDELKLKGKIPHYGVSVPT